MDLFDLARGGFVCHGTLLRIVRRIAARTSMEDGVVMRTVTGDGRDDD